MSFLNNPQRDHVTEIAKEIATNLYSMLSLIVVTDKPTHYCAYLLPHLFNDQADKRLIMSRLVREIVTYAEQAFNIRYKPADIESVLEIAVVEGTQVQIAGGEAQSSYVVSFRKDAFFVLWRYTLLQDLRNVFHNTIGDKKTGTILERSLEFPIDKTFLVDNLPGVTAELVNKVFTETLQQILIDRKLGNIRRSKVVTTLESITYYATVVEYDEGNVLVRVK